MEDSLADLYIPLPIHRHIAARLSDVVDDMRFVGHIPLSERDHVLQMVRQEFPSYVDTLHMCPDDLPIFDRYDVTKGVTDI